jgi:hypothetical protein
MRIFIRHYPNIVYLCSHDYSETKKKGKYSRIFVVHVAGGANNFDMDSIRRTIVERYDQPDDVKEEIAKWYEELIEMMRSEGVKEKGHIQLNKNVIIALTDLHLRLLKSSKEMVYGAAYYKTLPFIVQLRAKSGGEDLPELETCFNAIYGFLMLKMQGKEISPETMEGIKQISSFLALLAEKYREDMNGELKLEE